MRNRGNTNLFQSKLLVASANLPLGDLLFILKAIHSGLDYFLVWGPLHCTNTKFTFCIGIQFYFIYLIFLAVLSLRCCARAFSSCGERGLLFVAVHGLLIVVVSLVVEHVLQAYGLQ